MFGLDGVLGEGLTFFASLGGLGGLVAMGQGLQAVGMAPSSTRRLVHAGVALFVVGCPALFSVPLSLYLLSGLFVVGNAVARWKGWWSSIHAARPKSWGTVALPLAVFPAVAATWGVSPDRVFILQAAFLVLAVADPLASVVGEALGKREWVSGATWWGSGTFLAAAILVVGTVLIILAEWPLAAAVAAALIVALAGMATEALARNGWDNLFVILAVVLALVPLHEARSMLGVMAGGVVVGIGVMLCAVGSGALDRHGGGAAGLFAATLVGLGGWEWVLPGFAFFVLASGLSWLPAGSSMDGGSGRPQRTVGQVLANGGIAWGLLGVFVVLPPGMPELRALCYAGFLGALAAAAADTWATEMGVRFAGRPRSLRTFARVTPGTSGAVSLVGTGAAAVGAATVAVAALLGGGVSGAGGAVTAVTTVVAGLVGMGVDGLAGALFEAPNPAARVEERATSAISEGTPERGWACIDNEIVNLMGTAAGAAVAILLYSLAG